ncbi:MAG: hypothetical protein ISS80_02510 [Candidatus Cloacimonetes bacterium]|nr:hypothetical protein [Candidatus Cloacimonadota bacterium]
MNNIDKRMLKFASEVLDNQYLYKTFYFKKGTNPKYCILMEKPGKYIRNEEEELKKIISNNNRIESYLNFYIRYLIKWILRDNGKKPFFKPFFEKVLPIKPNSAFNEKFLNDNILNDFYFSDIDKFRPEYINQYKEKKQIKKKNGIESFREEIDILCNIQLIFVFGNVAFKSLMSNENINIIEDGNNIINEFRNKLISELHGSLYRWHFSDTRKIFIIPLIHPRLFKVTIRDTYFDYLKKGLTEYRKIANMKK